MVRRLPVLLVPAFFMRTETITIDLVVIIITLCSYTCHSLVTRYNIRLTPLPT